MQGTKILALVHSDLASPIQPLVKDDYKYVINLIDDGSGLTMLYFLKRKSNTLLATKKYLTDIAPYSHLKCIRTDNGMELNLFNDYLYLIGSNMSSQLLILRIKIGLLNGHGELYFLWQSVSLLSQNYPKTCGFTH